MVTIKDKKQLAERIFANSKTVVIKVGSSLLVDEMRNSINRSWLTGIASDISRLKLANKSVVVVSSGAIALGRRLLKIDAKNIRLQEKQAAAAVGQVVLADAWKEALNVYEIQTAQILLSPDDTETRRKHLNARSTISALLKLGAIPVVNENDTVATAEIRFGDNDRLAARVAAMIGADLLVLLSDIDGLYTGDPKNNKNAQHIDEVNLVTPKIMAMAGTANASYASGGMVTKLEAARIAAASGCAMIICDGRHTAPLSHIEKGACFTLFKATQTQQNARKKWIAGALTPKGKMKIDDGATVAVSNGRSLLPAGILRVSGQFERGDLIQVEDSKGFLIGHGLVSYSSEDAKAICGHKSHEIESILGYRGRDEMIHADNLVIAQC